MAEGGSARAGKPAADDQGRCWLCGARLGVHQLVADGGSACEDVRWYCRDTRACTERWTAQRPRRRDAGEPALRP